MKKFLALISSIVMLSSFTGCAPEEITAVMDKYDAVVESITSWEYQEHAVMQLEIEGESYFDRDITATVLEMENGNSAGRYEGIDNDGTRHVNYSVYNKGDYSYLDAERDELSEAYKEKTLVVDTSYADEKERLKQLDESAFLKADLKELEDGDKEIYLKLDPSKLDADFMDSYIKSYLSPIGWIEIAEAQVLDVSYTLVIDENYYPVKEISKAKARMILDDGSEAEYEIYKTVKYIEFNTFDHIVFPPDLDDYDSTND